MDVPRTPGNWTIRRTASRETVAAYSAGPDKPLFNLTCNSSSRLIWVVRPGTAASPLPARILTETRERAFTMESGKIGNSVAASFSVTDPLLDSMALTKGRFAVETEGMPTLYLPAWAEVSRVIEDCR